MQEVGCKVSGVGCGVWSVGCRVWGVPGRPLGLDIDAEAAEARDPPPCCRDCAPLGAWIRVMGVRANMWRM